VKNEKEPVLSDVISALISSLAKGRFVADVEAMRLAMQYEKIDLLQGLPVPRLRINNVKINMPVILTEVVPSKNAVHAPISHIVETTLETVKAELDKTATWLNAGIARAELEQDHDDEKLKRLKWFQGLLASLNNSDVNFVSLFNNEFSNRLKNDLDVLETVMHGVVSAPALMKLVSNSAKKSLEECMQTAIFVYLKKQSTVEDNEDANGNARTEIKKYFEHKIVQELISKICYSAERSTIEQDDQAAELKLLVDTESIKNAGGGPDTVTRLSFTVREEGLEWVTDVTEESTTKRLTPE